MNQKPPQYALITQGWTIIIRKTSTAQNPKTHRDIADYNPAYQQKRPEVPELIAESPGVGISTDVYDYIGESKVHPLLRLEMRQSPMGSESDLCASPEADPAVVFEGNRS